MSKQNIEESVESRVCFEELEDWVGEKIQGWVQELLEEEVTELLGRRKSERRRAVDAPSGYRNGYGKPRHLTLSSGTIQVRRPRVRDLEEHFESRVLPLFAKRTRQVRELIPELYLHGLALGDFDLALRGLLGEKAHLSSSPVARLKEKWQAEWEVWQSRPLNDLEVVYLWVDGIYVKAGLEKEKAVLLVVLAALSDGSKAVVSVTSGYRESTQSWYAETREEAQRLKKVFQHWCRQRGLTLAAELIEQDWDRMVTFYNYPKKQWQHLRTTNPVESPFAALRLRTDAAKRFKKVENAQAVIWKMLLVAEQRFLRLKAPELMKDVYQGTFVTPATVRPSTRCVPTPLIGFNHLYVGTCLTDIGREAPTTHRTRGKRRRSSNRSALA